MGERVTAPKLLGMKERGERIVCLTAYDATFGAIADEAGVDVVLVGDSLANVMLGLPTTLPVSLDQMAHHVQAVSRGVREALLVADLPFGSYGASVAQAVESAAVLIKAGAEAVKLEGDYPEEIRGIVRTGVPVMGHLGFTPQSFHRFGGYKVQGRSKEGAEDMQAQARELEAAGAFSIVLELVPSGVAEGVSKMLTIPTIGIGAGAGCDGQIQVLHDVLGLGSGGFKHAKAYVDGRKLLREALAEYTNEVRRGQFPTEANSF